MSQEKLTKFIECLIPVTVCNLKCEYCYIIQENRRKNEMPKFQYTAKQIRNGLSKKRLGGIAYISICGAGETLLPKEIVEIVKELLEEGHYINITTNGTITNRIEELLTCTDKENIKRLHFAFSLHYIELKNKNLLSKFVENVDKVRKSNASFTLQMNLCDSYIDISNEIKAFCMDNFGFLPQLALTRNEKNNNEIEIFSKLSQPEYYEAGKDYNSELFKYTIKNFNIKRKEFCYAGDWSFLLNLCTGKMKQCYASKGEVDIIKNPNKKIKFNAIGKNCQSAYCINSSHFLSLGVIPEIKDESYAALRNKNESIKPVMQILLSQKLYNNCKEYSKTKKAKINIHGKIKYGVIKCGKKVKGILKKGEQ